MKTNKIDRLNSFLAKSKNSILYKWLKSDLTLDGFITLLSLLTLYFLVSTLGGYWSHPHNLGMFMNGDLTAYSYLPHNLIYEHGSLLNWHLGPAPYYFPDISLLYLSSLFLKNPYQNFLVFALFQIIYFVGIILTIFKSATKSKLGFRIGWISALFFLLILDMIHTFHLYWHYDYLITILTPGFHFGSTLVVFTSLFLFNKVLFDGSKYLLILLGVLLILTGVSDQIMNMYFIFPGIISLTVLFFLKSIEKYNYFLLTSFLTIVFVTAFVLYHALPLPYEKVPLLVKFHFIYLFDVLKAIFTYFIKHDIIIGLMWLSFVIYAPISLKQSYKSKGRLDSKIDFLILFEFVTVVTALPLLLLLVSSELVGKAAVWVTPLRYMIPFILGPAFIGFPLLLYKHWSKRTLFLNNLWYINLLLIFSLIALLFKPNVFKSDLYNFYPKIAACVDQHVKSLHLHNGLSTDFEAANMLTSYAKMGEHVLLFNSSNITPEPWLDNASLYSQNNFDFVVTPVKDGIHVLQRKFGKPDNHFICQGNGLKYYVYTYQHHELKNLFL